MKILFTIGTLTHGGAERVVSILSSKLAEMGHEVEILLYYNREICFQVSDKVKVSHDGIKGNHRNIIKHIKWRRNYISELQPDVVVSFLAPFNMVTIVSMFGLDIPIIVADRNDPTKVPTKRIIRFFRNFLYSFADGIVLQNKSNQKYFSEGIQKKSTVIFNPIDLGKYEGSALKCVNKEKIIVSVARVIEQKNPLVLLDAFYRICKEFPDYKLIYYGEGNLINKVIKEAQELGIEDRVFLPGAVSDIFEKINKASLFVLNSKYEGMPNALLEAMCIGLPVISTKVSGAVDVIEDNVNGMLINCNNADELSEAIRKMLNNETFSNYCANNAIKISKDLDVDNIVHQWEEFIRKTIQQYNKN